MLKELTDIIGISGHEHNVVNYIKKETNVEFVETKMGSIIAKIDSGKPGPKILLGAHMDEIGFIVKQISPDGKIKVASVGGINPINVINRQVVLENDNFELIDGVTIGTGDFKNLEIEDLLFDFGFSTQEEVIKSSIAIGNQITFKNNFLNLSGNKVSAKSFDNRVACYYGIDILNTFEVKSGCLYVAFTVQEEMGLKAPNSVIQMINDDLDSVIVVDVSPLEGSECQVGKGPLIRIKDPRMIFNYELVKDLRNIATKNNIEYQNFFSRGGTDAIEFQMAGKSNNVVAVCIGANNLHSQCSVMSKEDFDNGLKLVKYYLEEKLRG